MATTSDGSPSPAVPPHISSGRAWSSRLASTHAAVRSMHAKGGPLATRPRAATPACERSCRCTGSGRSGSAPSTTLPPPAAPSAKRAGGPACTATAVKPWAAWPLSSAARAGEASSSTVPTSLSVHRRRPSLPQSARPPPGSAAMPQAQSARCCQHCIGGRPSVGAAASPSSRLKVARTPSAESTQSVSPSEARDMMPAALPSCSSASADNERPSKSRTRPSARPQATRSPATLSSAKAQASASRPVLTTAGAQRSRNASQMRSSQPRRVRTKNTPSPVPATTSAYCWGPSACLASAMSSACGSSEHLPETSDVLTAHQRSAPALASRKPGRPASCPQARASAGMLPVSTAAHSVEGQRQRVAQGWLPAAAKYEPSGDQANWTQPPCGPDKATASFSSSKTRSSAGSPARPTATRRPSDEAAEEVTSLPPANRAAKQRRGCSGSGG
mmetsp:Transcript_71959/g.227459  ORF Transcript_71959/g.227459 Transcript_71959/m.227459 type:complete len:446 (+) Transcript_71959:1243-2580(+)